MPFQNNVLAGASGATGYDVPYSLRFRAANSAYLNRTPASAGNRKTATISIWFKRGNISSAMDPLGVASGNTEAIRFNAGNTLMIRFGNLDSTTNAVFRDPSGWGHLVVARDTTQATSTNRLLAWWNGVALTFSSYSVPAQNADTDLFNTVVHNLGASSGPGNIYDGYMAEVNFIDGQALTPSSFGQTDATTGVWVPKKYSGTYGTNGFYLKFADASAATAAAIGKDSSGNGNNWTPSGISVTAGATFDQMLDTPTLNYAVMSTVDKGASMSTSNGGLRVSNTSGGSFERIRSSIGMTTGKWYAEFVINTEGSPSRLQAGLMTGSAGITTSFLGNGDALSWSIYESGGSLYKVTNSTTTLYVSGGTLDPTDVHMLAYDADAGKFWYGKNGTWFASGNPASGTNEMFSSVSVSGQAMFFASSAYNSSDLGTWNFGQRAFAYTPPTGFKALNTANLPTPSIKKGSLYMDATLRTGTGATASVSSLGFQPDFVWIKSRSAATDHGLYDAVRGVQKQLESNTITAETTETTGLTAFNSNGYTVGSLAQLNTSAATYVDWAWKEGATPGFDIVTWTADGTSPRNISHSLGAVPKFIITKQRSPSVENWFTYHASLGATKNVRLDETAAAQTQVGQWNNTEPTSTQFTTGNLANFTTNGNTLVAYLWSEIEGFSKFGSYTGNGSTDGPFVWCGHRPRWLLVKRTSSIGSWYLIDTTRNPYNATSVSLLAENSVSEGGISNPAIDIVSNGMKIRNTIADFNSSGSTYIFAAFAENPFKYSRAR